MAKCPKCGLDFSVAVRKCPNCQTLISPRKKETFLELPKLKVNDKDVEVLLDENKLNRERKEIKVKQIPLKVKKVSPFKRDNKDDFVAKSKSKQKNSLKLEKEKFNFGFESTLKIVLVSILLIINLVLIVNIVVEVDGSKPVTLASIPEETVKQIATDVSLVGSWITQNEGLFMFQDDYKFYWYDSYQVQDDNYYGGSYNFKSGLDALAEMGYSEEEFIKEFGDNVNLNNVYSIQMLPEISYKNRKDNTLVDLNENESWWMLFIIDSDTSAIGYNKTLDLRYIFKKD